MSDRASGQAECGVKRLHSVERDPVKVEDFIFIEKEPS
jgi:hypothetical protein